jgi:hypothetical protein
MAHDVEDHLPHSPAVPENFGSWANPHSCWKTGLPEILKRESMQREKSY